MDPGEGPGGGEGLLIFDKRHFFFNDYPPRVHTQKNGPLRCSRSGSPLINVMFRFPDKVLVIKTRQCVSAEYVLDTFGQNLFCVYT